MALKLRSLKTGSSSSKASTSSSDKSKRTSSSPAKETKKQKTDSADEDASHMRRPHGDVVAVVNGKLFYRSVMIFDELFSVHDSVDVLRTSNRSKKLRESNLAKIAAIYVDTNGKLMAEVSFYFDSGEKLPEFRQPQEGKRKWRGFTHVNEVIAFNKVGAGAPQFEDVEIETFDEKVNVHSSLEKYQEEIDSGGDEEINVFCNFMCYHERDSIVPFDIETEWDQVMLESSKYHSVYIGNEPPAREQKRGPEKRAAERRAAPELNLQLNSNERILGREEEADQIRTFLETNIKQGGTGQILYISGVPGTGKTETVKMVARELVNKKLKGELPWFDLVEINAVHLSKPNELYRVFYNKLFGKPAPNDHASYEALDKYFNANSTPCVLVLDEADYIVSKTQKVLFTLFDLPCKRDSKFILIVISNTMDLNYKMKSSIQSRLGFGSLVFKPYRYQQIVQVIEDKLGKFSPIDPVALQLCARRVTNYSGDMRKALQICKLALKEANGRKITVGRAHAQVNDMSRISGLVLNSSIVDALQYVSVGMKCLLVAIILVLKDLELAIAPAVKVYRTFRGMITVLKPELEHGVCRDSFKHLLLASLNNGIVALEPTVFPAFSFSDRKKVKRVFDDINEDLGDVGITFQVDVAHLVTALSKDPYWQSKLEAVA